MKFLRRTDLVHVKHILKLEIDISNLLQSKDQQNAIRVAVFFNHCISLKLVSVVFEMDKYHS